MPESNPPETKTSAAVSTRTATLTQILVLRENRGLRQNSGNANGPAAKTAAANIHILSAMRPFSDCWFVLTS